MKSAVTDPGARESSGPAARKLNPLTSLRFLAAAMVVLVHAASPFDFPVGTAWATRLTNGVSFFFVLSGFILVYVYSGRELLEKRRFLLARVARLWPAHVSALVLWLVLVQDWHSFSFPPLLATLAMVQAWIPVHGYYVAFVPPSWSISTEFGFYLGFLFLIKNLRQTWPMKLAGSLLLLLAMIALTCALEKYVTPPPKTPWAMALIYFNPLSRFFEFALGMSTAVLWRRFAPRFRHGIWMGTVLEITAIGLVVFLLLHSDGWAHAAGLRSWVGRPGETWLARAGLCCGGLAWLIFVFALEQGFLARCLSLSIPVLLGELSYSIYLVHDVFIKFYEARARFFGQVPGPVNFVIFGVATVATSYLIWALIERPCRRRILRLWPTPSLAAAAELPASMIAASGVPIKAAHPDVVLPSRRGVWSALVLLAVAVVPVCGMLRYAPGFEKISPERAQEIARQGRAELQSIPFGHSLVLLGVRIDDTDSSNVNLELAWQALAEQKLKTRASLLVTGAGGKKLFKKAYLQDLRGSQIAAGTTWREKITIPRLALEPGAAVTLGVERGKKEPLAPDRGELDESKLRLVLPLNTTASPQD